MGRWRPLRTSGDFNGQGVQTLVEKVMQRIIHKAMALHTGLAGKQW